MTALTRPIMDQTPVTSSAPHRDAAAEAATSSQATAEEKRFWFEKVYAENHGMIFGFLRARVLDYADADDLAQEVFLRFYAGLERYDPARNPNAKPWLRGISRNVLREHIRKKTRRKEVGWTELCLELDELIGSDLGEDDRLGLLPNCIKSLGDSAKHAIRAHYMQGKKLKVIAQEMDRTLGAVKVLMVRSRQALRKCVEAEITKAKAAQGAPADAAAEGGEAS